MQRNTGPQDTSTPDRNAADRQVWALGNTLVRSPDSSPCHLTQDFNSDHYLGAHGDGYRKEWRYILRGVRRSDNRDK
jgi:hypothetical protein